MKPKDIVICIKTIKHNKLNKQYKILSIHKNEITVHDTKKTQKNKTSTIKDDIHTIRTLF